MMLMKNKTQNGENMNITYDPSKIKVEIIVVDENGNSSIQDSGKTLADHLKECPGCPYCD